MTKRKVSQLFAVVVVGISAPAAASPDAPMAPRTLPSGAPAAGNAQAKPMPRSTPTRSPTRTAAPRTLPSGAPACGNVQSKKPRDCTTATTPAVKPTPVAATPSQQAARPSMPRTLPSGAPACGNVLAKLDGNKNEVAYQNCLKGIDPTEYVRQAMVIHKLLVAVGLEQPASWEVAAPRQYRSGAPACGNVATRSGTMRRRDCD